jgi:hypothetical protein
MSKRTVPHLLLSVLLLLCGGAIAQVSTNNAAPSNSNGEASSQPTVSPELASDLVAYGQMLNQLQQVAQQTASDLNKLRIDKWKADGNTKQQSQSNSSSLQRNLTAALPEMIQKAQAAPQDFGPSFKLYRNLNAVYDVLASTAENAGAFGPKEQYEPLANDVGAFDQVRRSMADRLDWLSGVKDTQLIQLRQQLAAQKAHSQNAKSQPATSDNATGTSTTTKKPSTKKKKKPAASTPAPTDQQ